jgi:hypothetical protein
LGDLSDCGNGRIEEIGFVGCLSFTLMRRHRITAAFAFERHLESARGQFVGVRESLRASIPPHLKMPLGLALNPVESLVPREIRDGEGASIRLCVLPP